MIFTTRPPDGPARRVWCICSVLVGEVLELSFEQEFEGNQDGWWRVKFYNAKISAETVMRIPAKNFDTISDDEISRLRSQERKIARLKREAEAAERRIIRLKVDLLAMEEPGEYTSDVIFERRGGKVVRRLQIRKRRPDERPPMIQ